MILVSGASGLLGSHLIYSLVNSGQQVRATQRDSSNLDEVKRVFSFYSDIYDELFQKIEWVEADLLNPESMVPLFNEVDKVYNVAASVSFDPRDRKRIINQNREIAANIVNTCLDLDNIRLLHVSSTSALGNSDTDDLVTEEDIWAPEKNNSGYSISKFLSEMEVWRGIEEGLNAVIVNPSIILGPGFPGRSSSSLFSSIKKGLRYYTRGTTGYVGVQDVVEAMITLMNSDIRSERFILSSENLSYQEAFTLIARELGVKPPSVEATPLMAGIAWRLDALRSVFGGKRLITRETVRAAFSHARFSNEKIRKTLGIDFAPINEVVAEIVALERRS